MTKFQLEYIHIFNELYHLWTFAVIRLFQHHKEIELDRKKLARDLVENTQVRQFFRFSVKRVFFFSIGEIHVFEIFVIWKSLTRPGFVARCWRRRELVVSCRFWYINHSHAPKLDNYVGRTVNKCTTNVMNKLTNKYQCNRIYYPQFRHQRLCRQSSDVF